MRCGNTGVYDTNFNRIRCVAARPYEFGIYFVDTPWQYLWRSSVAAVGTCICAYITPTVYIAFCAHCDVCNGVAFNTHDFGDIAQCIYFRRIRHSNNRTMYEREIFNSATVLFHKSELARFGNPFFPNNDFALTRVTNYNRSLCEKHKSGCADNTNGNNAVDKNPPCSEHIHELVL